MAKLTIDWLMSSVPEDGKGIIRMFGIILNEFCWAYFTIDLSGEPPTSRKDVWASLHRGNDEEMKKLMYSLLIFAEDDRTEQFAKSVLDIINGIDQMEGNHENSNR